MFWVNVRVMNLEQTVSQTPFTDEELELFESVFEERDDWARWIRRPGPDGRDVIELTVVQEVPCSVRMTKAGTPTSYMAAGLKGWSLIVCSTFDELLQTISGETARLRQQA